MTSINLSRSEARARSAIVSVESYRVRVDLTGVTEESEQYFSSTTTVDFRCATPGSDTFIDLRGADELTATFNGALLPASNYSSENGLRLTDLRSENTLEVTARLPYSTSGEGLHRMVDPADGAVYLYTQFETGDAKRMFACFDQPDIKARFDITVVAPKDWTVISNAAIADSTDHIAGGSQAPQKQLSEIRFHSTELLSTYLVALIAGPYAGWTDEYRDENASIPLGIFCRASLAEYMDEDRLFAETKQGFAFYHREFGVAYPFGKYDQIFVPEFNAGAMENAGAVTFLEDYVFRSKVTGYLYERRAETILHEMAHMWFGDLVTMRWWDDLWLNESFATYASVLCQVEATEYTGAWTSFANIEKSWAYRQDQLPSTHPVAADMTDLETVDSNFDGITYAKGASVLKQLVAYVGREPFMAGLRQYFVDHSFANAEYSDLISALEKSSGRDLSWWADQWLRTTGINELGTQVSADETGTIIDISITQAGARPGLGELRTHRVGLGLYTRDGDGKIRRSAASTVDISGANTPVEELRGHAVPDIILVNDEDLAYCSIALDERSLATALSDIENIVDPLARTLCWSALWEMTRSARLPARTFIAVVCRAIGQETEIGVVQRVLSQALTAVDSFADPRWADTAGWSQLSTALLEWARSAEPGSDHQLAFVSAAASCVLSDTDAKSMLACVDSGPQAAGLTGLDVDTDLRWTLLTAAVANGVVDPSRIDTELKSDDTASGARRAAAARAAIPSEDAKSTAARLVLLSGEAAPTNAIVRATLAGISRAGHGRYLHPLSTHFAASAQQIWRDRPGDLAQTIVTGLFPSWDISDDAVATYSEFARDPALTSGLRRIIEEGVADIERALAARKLDQLAGKDSD